MKRIGRLVVIVLCTLVGFQILVRVALAIMVKIN